MAGGLPGAGALGERKEFARRFSSAVAVLSKAVGRAGPHSPALAKLGFHAFLPLYVLPGGRVPRRLESWF